MKKLFLSLTLLASVLAFNACSTDVELYADYKEIPVIYGLLDASQDTNFIRINRAFSGNNEHSINANEVALIEDSCNYPGKLKAYIVEFKEVYGGNYSPTGDTLLLDTMTVHDKQEGIFYSPDQKVYFTDGKTTGNQSVFDNNSPNSRYRYKLFVYHGNDTITAETGLVGGDNFKITTTNAVFNPQPSDNTKRLKFTAADNAVFYDVKMIFHYRESHNNGPFVDKEVVYSSGPKNIESLGVEEQSYYIVYAENMLFNLLEEAIGSDTVTNTAHPHVVRYFDPKPMEVIVSAGGDELYNYIQVNQQTGYSQTIPDYTNITGGYGVFSSRINLTKYITISSGAATGIYGKPWGFKQQ